MIFLKKCHFHYNLKNSSKPGVNANDIVNSRKKQASKYNESTDTALLR